MPTISVVSPADPAADAAVTDGLRAHLSSRWGDAPRTDLSVCLRDEAGQVVGGLIGRLAWGWLYVDRFWVDAAFRRLGHGAALLEAAEAFALERGHDHAHLDTFGEDALPFYVRHGYEVWGTLDGLPPGSRKYHLKKNLRHSAARA